MKKKPNHEIFFPSGIKRKKLLAMKLLLCFILFSMLNVSGSIFSQNTTFDLSVRGKTVKEVFKDIESQSQFRFLYNDDFAGLNRRVSFSADEKDITEVLNELLSGANLTYRELENDLIVITPAELAMQQSVVSGTVTDAEGDPLPGVSIVIQGTTRGVVTDVDGRYSISVPGEQSVLVYTFVGMQRQEITAEGRSVIDVVLQPESIEVDEVVVTALGISRERKSLGYSVAEVSGEDLQQVAQENVLNALAGKVAGVSVSSTGPAGSSVSMVIRGATSFTSDNQPLFVVDGIPINNTLNNVQQMGRDNRADFGNAISDLNPEDFKSVTVLKGPSAAALYGSRAGNGVVLITTKSGDQRRGLETSFTTNTVIENPYKYFPIHYEYANGIFPYDQDNRPNNNLPYLLINADDVSWFGPKLDDGIMAYQWPYLNEAGELEATELVSYPDNPKNFFQTGFTTINTIAVSDATENIDYRLSYSNLMNKGVIPNSDLSRNSLSLNSSVKVLDNVSLSTIISYTNSGADNRPAGNRGANPMQALYEINPHIDILSMKDYWEPGQEGLQQKAPYLLEINPDGTFTRKAVRRNNPFFLANEINNGFNRDRFTGNAEINWQINSDFSFRTRYSHDQFSESRETKMAPSYSLEPNGMYGITNLFRREQNADFLISYNKLVGDFNFSASGGGNYMYQYAGDNTTKAQDRGSGLVIPGLYSLGNIAQNNIEYNSRWSEKSIYSLYALSSIGYRDFIYLDLTARNDWSSTLPKENNSYFYPSASLSILANNIFDLGRNVSLAKIRGGWAQVGNDTDPYRLNPVMGSLSNWGSQTRLITSGTLLLPDLKPEIQTSWEIGTDLALFNNRLRFEGTYYEAENENQILGIGLPPTSGYDSRQINAGLISSRGYEVLIGGAPVRTSDWNLDMNFVYSWNRAVIEDLTEGINSLTLWRDARGGAVTWIGEEIGQLVDARMIRVEDENSEYFGWPLLNANGGDQSDRSMEGEDGKRAAEVIGNFNPDFTLGSQNALSYKRWTLNLSINWRKGGQFVSQTMRYGGSDSHIQEKIDRAHNLSDIDDIPAYLKENADKYLLPGGEFWPVIGGNSEETGGFPYTAGGITTYNGAFLPGVAGSYDGDGNFVADFENLGGPETVFRIFAMYPWNYTRAATYDADFVKLQEVSISYQLPSVQFLGIKNASFSIYSRNIILWTKAKIGIDPELAFQPESGVQGSGIQFKQGIERFNLSPWTIPVGFKLNLTF